VQLADYRSALRTALSSESKAYGFTLAVWGSGSLLMSERGLPGRSGTVAFVAGVLAGVAGSITIALGGPASDWASNARRRIGGGAVHLLSVGTALAAAWIIGAGITVHWLAYLLAGIAAGLLYQLVLGLEVAVTSAQEQQGG
jgi:hypothetical protein